MPLTEQNPAWTIDKSAETYAINSWGDRYFSINQQGNVCVKPCADKSIEIDLHEIAMSLQEKNLSLPVLVRFIDILKDRVHRLDHAFEQARIAQHYKGN